MKRCVIFGIILILVLMGSVCALINTQHQDSGETIPQILIADDGTIPEGALETSVDDKTTTVFVDESTSIELQGTTPSDVDWETPQGSITSFSMTNALFSLGSLIQGSFISFSNNNNIFFSSLFDAAKFTATLNEDGSIKVGQMNGNGDLGRVYITINNGNLTQDDEVIFIPDGNEPTYIYYNTTEIEFKDGNVTLLGETVTNNDDSSGRTTIQFDANGFTKVELPIENSYTIGDFNIKNTGSKTLIICKKDPLCDVNIDESIITLKGKVNFSEKDELLFESLDTNNEIILDISNKTITFFNSNPSEEVLMIANVKNHRITETTENVYEYPTANGIKYFTYESKLHNKFINLKENFVYGNFTAYENTFENYTPAITGSLIGTYENDLGLSLVLVTILIGLLVFVQYKRKAQMSIMILFGLALVVVVALILYFSATENNLQQVTEIESLEQAQEAVESCETDKIEEGVALLGMHTGYIDESFSEYGTAYELIPTEAMEENLRVYLERELRECGLVLDGTKFSFEANRFEVTTSLEEEVAVEVSSIGSIKNENTINVNEIKEQYDINYAEIISIMQELTSGEYGMPVNSYDDYTIESYVNSDLSERLIIIKTKNNFEFRMSEKL